MLLEARTAIKEDFEWVWICLEQKPFMNVYKLLREQLDVR